MLPQELVADRVGKDAVSGGRASVRINPARAKRVDCIRLLIEKHDWVVRHAR